VKKALLIIVVGLVVVAVIADAADYAALRYRVLWSRSPFGSVTVHQYYEVQEKNQRTEYVDGPTQQQSCVNSLFSHLGLSPCWYLRQHTEQTVKI
jgi:hypothetical protein